MYLASLKTLRTVAAVGLLFLGHGALDLPFTRQKQGSLLRFFHHVVALLAEFTADVHIAILGAIDDEIEMTGVARLVGFHANEFNVVALVGTKRSKHNKQRDGNEANQERSHMEWDGHLIL